MKLYLECYSERVRKIANDLFILLMETPIGAITNIHELPKLPFLKQPRDDVQAEMDFLFEIDESLSDEEYFIKKQELWNVEDCLNKIVEKDGRIILDYSANEGTEVYSQEGGRDFLLLINNRKKQDCAAREFAKQERIYDVSFAFYWQGMCFYDIKHDPKICVELRWPLVYVVVEQNLHVRYSTDEESVAYAGAPREPLTNHPWGQEIYQSYLERVKQGIGSSYEQRIIASCDNQFSYDASIPKPMMYRALEEAEALDMKVDIVPNIEYQTGGSREGQCDGWEYHPEVINKPRCGGFAIMSGRKILD